MEYYRKAAAVFIVIIALLLPFFMEVEKEVAVVDLKNLVKESKTLSSIAEKKNETKAAEKEIRQLIEAAAAEYAEENSYSSVITKYAVYKGGQNITTDLAKKIDREK